jgi:hypothetical protein
MNEILKEMLGHTLRLVALVGTAEGLHQSATTHAERVAILKEAREELAKLEEGLRVCINSDSLPE